MTSFEVSIMYNCHKYTVRPRATLPQATLISQLHCFELRQKISSYTDFSELHTLFFSKIYYFFQPKCLANSSKIASLFAKQSTENKVAEKTIEINKSLVFGIEESSHVL